jgi:hypothetical protein
MSETSTTGHRNFAILATLASLALALPVSAADLRGTLTNPTARSYENEPVRLTDQIPDSAKTGDFRVEINAREVPAQIAEHDRRKHVWAITSLAAGESVDYVIRRQTPRTQTGRVAVERSGNSFVLDNGEFAIRVPASGELPPPVLAVRSPAGRWLGSGTWHTARTLDSFRADVLDEGPIFARVRLRYAFRGSAGLWDNVPCFAQVDVSLFAGQSHALIEESHEMDRGDHWEFDCAAGWSAGKAICVPFGRMPAHGGREIPRPTSLRVGQTRMGDVLVNLQPRWTQAYDEGWLFACHDDETAVGAIPVYASRWHWPHNNLISVIVKPSGNYAGLRCPTWKGRRAWFLVAGPRDEWEEKAAKEYVVRHAFQSLDKLHHDYVLDWPGLEKLLTQPERGTAKLGGFRGFDFYSSWMNPTSGLRGFGRRLMREPGGQGNIDDLTQSQVFLDPDSYGSYWNFFSPENPNFFTDYNRCGILLTTKLQNHPQFREFAKLAEQKFHEDMYHAITLPGGAGQECPGYVAYAMHTWTPLAEICRKYLGFDPAKWPRYKAGAKFLLHVSQPVGDGKRRCHPGGDTHPPGPEIIELAAEMGVHEDITRLATEELPGFGVVFRNRPGTDRETYLALKSGPNRGHYHGDQLSFHYCANAKPTVIDHMCSYGPRAGQEHMHNRVAFHTKELPWANMDGYERLIAMKASDHVDVAVGQVESERLRITTEYPPEEWDTYLPQKTLDVPLVYRRTIVCLKDQGQDYFVIRDQHAGPRVHATYCLHVLSSRCERKGNQFAFDNLTVVCTKPAEFAYARHDWEFEKRDKSGALVISEHTKGIRLTVEDEVSEFITVLYPSNRPPSIESLPSGVRVGNDEITFAGGIDDDDAIAYVTVYRGKERALTLTGRDIDLERSQGEVGLFVPDAGYPFGEIPNWLIRQRSQVPAWAPEWAKTARQHELRSR